MNFHTCHQGLFFTCVPFGRFMQFAAYIIKWYFTSLILSWSTIYEADILHSYKHIVPFLVRRNMSQLVGRDPNERLWQAHKQNWTPQRLIELSDISGCDFLTVFRSRFKPKEQRHPSPSTVRRTGLETVSDVIVPTLFRDLRKELLILHNSIPCTQNITLYKWLVMTGAQHKTGIHQPLTQESELNRQITNNQRPRFVQMEKPWSFTFMTLSKSALH